MKSLLSIAPCIDHTLLDIKATPEALRRLCKEAMLFKAACVCIYPHHLKTMTSSLKRASVLNFPSGNESLQDSLKTLRWIIHQKSAEEIDYVFPYTAYLTGHMHLALQTTQTIIQTCQDHQLCIKVILETECFHESEQLYTLSLKLIAAGAHFLKTSTGTLPIGATTATTATLLQAIQDSGKSCGIKISGGIRTLDQANHFIDQAESCFHQPIHASWFRIGSSQLLKI